MEKYFLLKSPTDHICNTSYRTSLINVPL